MPWRSRCALPAPRLHQQRGLRFLKFGTRERSWLGSARQKPNRAGRLPHLLWPLARLPSPRRRASRDQRRCICQLPPGTSLIQSAAVRAQLRGLPRPGSSMGSTRVLYCTAVLVPGEELELHPTEGFAVLAQKKMKKKKKKTSFTVVIPGSCGGAQVIVACAQGRPRARELYSYKRHNRHVSVRRGQVDR